MKTEEEIRRRIAWLRDWLVTSHSGNPDMVEREINTLLWVLGE